mmetsp:Transcript_25149/g.59366  ORF Transcript_25149/g.59366 Transcript_25149/m.59366 type:complete len:109 (-) Transcript_25149:325-651(-)
MDNDVDNDDMINNNNNTQGTAHGHFPPTHTSTQPAHKTRINAGTHCATTHSTVYWRQFPQSTTTSTALKSLHQSTSQVTSHTQHLQAAYIDNQEGTRTTNMLKFAPQL